MSLSCSLGCDGDLNWFPDVVDQHGCRSEFDYV